MVVPYGEMRIRELDKNWCALRRNEYKKISENCCVLWRNEYKKIS